MKVRICSTFSWRRGQLICVILRQWGRTHINCTPTTKTFERNNSGSVTNFSNYYPSGCYFSDCYLCFSFLILFCFYSVWYQHTRRLVSTWRQPCLYRGKNWPRNSSFIPSWYFAHVCHFHFSSFSWPVFLNQFLLYLILGRSNYTI